MGQRESSTIAMIIIALFDTQFLPFMLSSAQTARTLTKEKNQEQKVLQDLYITLWVSWIFAAFVAWRMHSGWSALFGVGFGTAMVWLYTWRGELPGGLSAVLHASLL